MVRNYERTDVNRLNYVLDRWTGEGSTNSTPKSYNKCYRKFYFLSYFVEDASYLRIQNMQLGYALDPKYSERYYQNTFVCGCKQLIHVYKIQRFRSRCSNGAPIGGGIDYGFIQFLEPTYGFKH
jgi:hypothetical protein